MDVPYLAVFALNLAVEAAVLAAVLGFRLPVLRAAAVANLATHPLVWFAVPLVAVGWWWKTAVAEVLVVAVETALLWRLLDRGAWGRRRVALAALAANAVTAALTFVVPF